MPSVIPLVTKMVFIYLNFKLPFFKDHNEWKMKESSSKPNNLIFWCSGFHITSVVVKGSVIHCRNLIVATGIKEYKHSFLNMNK